MSNCSNLIKKEEIESLVGKEDYETVCKKAELIRDEVYHKNLDNGRSRDSVKSGVILAACRNEECPITPKKISKLFEVPVREVILSYRYICRNIDFLSVHPTKWTIFLEKYADTLDLTDKTVSVSFDIGKKGEDRGVISGRKPRSYAVSCIYASLQVQNSSPDTWITQRRLSEESGVGSSTIRTTYNKLLENY
jgi:transcription initiation factor TFIIB